LRSRTEDIAAIAPHGSTGATLELRHRQASGVWLHTLAFAFWSWCLP
jgi:hypothetical protein